MSPSQIGPYVIVDTLGHGGMGRVYLARDPRLDRLVAIKFLQGALAANPERRLRFLREARAEAALHHPNIATVLDVGEADVDLPELLPEGSAGGSFRVPYLVLEYVPGDDLRARIRNGPIPLDETLRITRQVVEGLRAAHASGIIHRDLKPGNIRIMADGRAKILDFGLARFVVEEAPTSGFSIEEFVTHQGVALGTPPYMAPEQGLGEVVDVRADFFALGVILYEMIGGHLPFRGEHTVELLQSVLRDEPTPLGQHAPWAPPRLVQLVHRLLAKNPGARPGSAAEVAQELDAIGRELVEAPTSVDGLPASSRSRSWGPSASRSWASFPRRRSLRLGLVVGVALLVVAAGAAFYFVGRGSRAAALDQFQRGERAAELEDHQAPRIAAELFERAAELDPGFALAWARASEAWADAFQREQLPQLLEKAAAAASRAEALAPAAEETRIARARMLRLEGRASEAIALLEPLPTTSTAGWKIHRELAYACEQAGDLAKAEERLLAAIGAREDYWGTWNDLGDFRIRTGDYSGARAALDRAAELAPEKEKQPEENLASLLFLEGDYAAALAAYERIPVSGASPATASNLGTLYYFNGRMDDAETAFRRAARMAPREALFHRNLADTLLRLGREDEARGEYAQALVLVDAQLLLTPGNEDLSLQRALYLARAGNCDEAVRFAAKIDLEMTDSARTQRALARPYALCGARDLALAQLRRAIALGFARQLLRDEDEFVSLRGDPEFDRLVGTSDGAGGDER